MNIFWSPNFLKLRTQNGFEEYNGRLLATPPLTPSACRDRNRLRRFGAEFQARPPPPPDARLPANVFDWRRHGSNIGLGGRLRARRIAPTTQTGAAEAAVPLDLARHTSQTSCWPASLLCDMRAKPARQPSHPRRSNASFEPNEPDGPVCRLQQERGHWTEPIGAVLTSCLTNGRAARPVELRRGVLGLPPGEFDRSQLEPGECAPRPNWPTNRTSAKVFDPVLARLGPALNTSGEQPAPRRFARVCSAESRTARTWWHSINQSRLRGHGGVSDDPAGPDRDAVSFAIKVVKWEPARNRQRWLESERSVGLSPYGLAPYESAPLLAQHDVTRPARALTNQGAVLMDDLMKGSGA